MSRINDKLSHKLKASKSQNSILIFELDDARAKVSQLESHCVILFENLITSGKEKEPIVAQCEKAAKEFVTLRIEHNTCRGEKEDLNVKLKMALSV